MSAYAAIVLAAGGARRFGADKLLRLYRGRPIVAYAIGAARAAPVENVVVVKRPGDLLDEACRAAADENTILIDAENEALSASLRAGLEAARFEKGAFVFLGDMPLVPHGLARQLAARIGDGFAAVPSVEGRPGHPVLLSARAAEAAKGQEGDHGAGALLRAHASDVVQVETCEPGAVFDVDTQADYETLSGGADH